MFAPQILHKLLFVNAFGFGGQTKCITGNSKIENSKRLRGRVISCISHAKAVSQCGGGGGLCWLWWLWREEGLLGPGY